MNKLRRTLSPQLRSLKRDSDGVTLPELLVTMMLLTMLLAMIMTIFVAFTRTFSDDRASSNNTASATVAMDELTRVIRAGTKNEVASSATLQPVFSKAGPDGVTLQAYIDTDAATPRPTQVEFVIGADDSLVERRWDAAVSTDGYFTFGGSVDSERTIARGVDDTASPVFLFFDKSYTEIEPVGGAIPTSKLSAIAAVQITLTLQSDDTGRAQPATLQNSVGIPNLNVSRIGPTR